MILKLLHRQVLKLLGLVELAADVVVQAVIVDHRWSKPQNAGVAADGQAAAAIHVLIVNLRRLRLILAQVLDRLGLVIFLNRLAIVVVSHANANPIGALGDDHSPIAIDDVGGAAVVVGGDVYGHAGAARHQHIGRHGAGIDNAELLAADVSTIRESPAIAGIARAFDPGHQILGVRLNARIVALERFFESGKRLLADLEKLVAGRVAGGEIVSAELFDQIGDFLLIRCGICFGSVGRSSGGLRRLIRGRRRGGCGGLRECEAGGEKRSGEHGSAN